MNNLEKEEIKFNKVLEKTSKHVKDLLSSGKEITGKMAFDLYQTSGTPFAITEEELLKSGIKIKYPEQFKEESIKHQELSRTAAAGKFKGGLADVSEKTKKLHTACHLLLAALRKVLGEHVEQKGSNITAERLRFDFSYAEKLTMEQKIEVEKIINEAIQNNLSVFSEEILLKDAKKQGAVGVFERKYGERVKVYTIGEKDNFISKEICGGPHAKSTGELGHFKIIKEEAVGQGIRRIKATAG